MDTITAEILKLVKTKMVEQAAYDRDSFDEIVEETINYYIERGKLGEDENIEFIKDQLTQMFESVKGDLAEE